MEELFEDIIEHVRRRGSLEEKELERILAKHNRRTRGSERHFAKKHLFPYLLKVRDREPGRWRAWSLSDAELEILSRALRMKPRRTQSGVATITVLTKPWPCSGACRYCPCDVRMPKSYLADEPACQRAERNCFDPYLQVASRLTALRQMGHATDKLEIIVLGGTFADYPTAYQLWFMREVFRAANDAQGSAGGEGELARDAAGAGANRADSGAASADPAASAGALARNVAKRRALYRRLGISPAPEENAARCSPTQE